MYSMCMNIYVYEYIHLYSLEICGIFSMENYKKIPYICHNRKVSIHYKQKPKPCFGKQNILLFYACDE